MRYQAPMGTFHCGISGNETADKATNLARKKTNINPIVDQTIGVDHRCFFFHKNTARAIEKNKLILIKQDILPRKIFL